MKVLIGGYCFSRFTIVTQKGKLWVSNTKWNQGVEFVDLDSMRRTCSADWFLLWRCTQKMYPWTAQIKFTKFGKAANKAGHWSFCGLCDQGPKCLGTNDKPVGVFLLVWWMSQFYFFVTIVNWCSWLQFEQFFFGPQQDTLYKSNASQCRLFFQLFVLSNSRGRKLPLGRILASVYLFRQTP